jgi:hypothetical protein
MTDDFRNKVNGDLDSLTVEVISHPVAAFGDSVLHTQAMFTDSSVGATSWLYNFGDNTAGQQIPDPSHSYRSQGSFTVRLIVSNGYCADTTYRTLVTDTCPASEIISYTVSGDTVSFNASQTGALQYSWHFGDGDSSVGINTSHIYSHSQNYLVSIWATTSKGCRVYGSTILPFTAVNGINELTGEGIKVYPNPTDDILHISMVPIGTIIGIYDLTGKKITEQNMEENVLISFNISSLSAGIYILKITGENLNLNQKLIKR